MPHPSSIRIGINGFGRIGRKIARLALDDPRFEIAAINNPGDIDLTAHLLKYDSAHGVLHKDVRVDGPAIWVDGKKIPCFTETDPTKIPWETHGVTIVHECSGIFTKGPAAAAHLKSGAKKVIISAPAKEVDGTFCMGVNHKTYDPKKHHVVSNASCTTNCLAPLVKVLDDSFGLIRGTMLTVHAYTNDQRVLDTPHKDFRRARAAAVSQIPTTTGAARAVGEVLPHLKGKLDGLAIRVPTPNVSMVDLTCEIKKRTSKEEINAAFRQAATSGDLKGYLGYSEEPLVSVDYNGNTMSSTLDSELTTVLDGSFVKVIAWYDNESGYSARMLDLSAWMAQKSWES